MPKPAKSTRPAQAAKPVQAARPAQATNPVKPVKPDPAANVRTALVLVTVAAVFFVGVIAARMFGPGDGGLVVLGLAVVLFLIVAIGRNLRSRK